MTLKDTHKPTSLQAAGSGPSQPGLLDGLTTNPCGPAPARASRSASRVKAEEPMIQGICGRTYFESSEARRLPGTDRLTLWENKLAARLAMVGSTESALIWRKKVTPAGRAIYRLAPSTRHINGTDCSGSLWTTVAARDWKDSAGMAIEAKDGRIRLDQLPRQMISYSPTPTVNDFTHSDLERLLARRAICKKTARNGNGFGLTLGNRMLLDATALSGPNTNGSSAPSTEKRGAPNPLFPFWLMGFPTEWVSGALRVAQSFRKSRQKSSKRSLKLNT